MKTTAADISLFTNKGATHVHREDLGLLAASFWRQGNWRLKLYISPDEYVVEQWADRETCERRAIRHAASL